MAKNAFDQFDEVAPTAPAQSASAANAFDQFDEVSQPVQQEIKTLPTVQAARPDPTDDMSQVDRFLAGLGKSFSDTGRGIYQLGVEAAENVARPAEAGLRYIGADEMADAVHDSASAPLTQRSQQLRDEEVETRRLDAPLLSTGAGLGGNVTGTVAQIIGPGLALRGTMAGAALLPRTVMGSAGQGVALGAVQPHVSTRDQVTNAALGGAVGGVAAAVPGLLGSARRGIASRLGGGVNASADERAAMSAIQREQATAVPLEISPSSVPGVNRTLGEATMDPGIMALENTMRASHRGTFDAIDRANNLARVGQIDRIAGTEADMAAAIGNRASASAAARQEAMQGRNVQLKKTIDAVRSAIENQRGRPAVQGGLREAERLIQQDAAGTAGSANQMDVIDNVRMSMGDMLGGKYSPDTPQALAGSRELIGIRNAMNDEVSEQVPAFGNYLSAYQEGSRPINRMELGRELLNRSSGATPDETGVRQLLPAQYSRQMNDLDATAARATGFGKSKASDILSEGDLNVLTDIQDDLSRQFRRQGSATAGSQTAERQSIASRLFGGTGDLALKAAQATPGIGGIVKDAAKGIRKGADTRLQEKLAYLLANPDEYQRLVQTLSAPKRKAVDSALAQFSRTSGVSTVPASTE